MKASAMMPWPQGLDRLRQVCALEEVASTLRHAALNEVAGVGALLFRLRRRLDARGGLADEEEIASVLRALDARVSGASEKLAVRFLPPAARPAQAELAAAARAIVAALAPPIPVSLAIEPGEERWAAVDAEELQVALGCLLENAVEAVAAAGRGSVTIRLAEAPPRLAVEVADDAEVIDPARAEQMLDPFFTTRRDHAGLGLKIARRIVQRWDGELLLERTEPRGLVARLALPAAG